MSSEYPESTEAQSRNTSGGMNASSNSANPAWERQVLSDLVQANLKEQQASRRWKNGLRLAWLLFWIVVMWQILSHNQTTSNITTPHTALVNIKGEIADVLLYLVRLSSVLGIDPIEAGLAKVEENRSRTWDF